VSAVAPVTPIRPATADEPVWLSPADVAARVPGLTVENLAELRKTGKGPAYFKPTGERGKVIIYSAADVDAWVRAARHTTREQK
jgi:hypothetical protein